MCIDFIDCFMKPQSGHTTIDSTEVPQDGPLRRAIYCGIRGETDIIPAHNIARLKSTVDRSF